MKVTCQVVTTPSVDTAGTAILLSLEAKRYLIGHIGEGTQRALLQRKIKTARIGDFFLTGCTEWRNVGGLLGLMLTLADQETARRTEHENKRQEAIQRLNNAQEFRPTGTLPTIPGPFEKKVLNIHGSDNLMHTLGTTRSYVFRTSMTTNLNEIKSDFEDEFLKIHPIKIYPEGYTVDPMDTSSSTDLSGLRLMGNRKRSFEGDFKSPKTREEILKSVVVDMFNSSWTMDTMVSETEIPSHVDGNTNADSVRSPRKVRAPWPAAMVKSLPRSSPSPAALSYIITLHPQRGRFLPDIAKKLGVTPGPEFRKLTLGESVINKDGKVVTPEECMEPQKPGKVILVLVIPDTSYVSALLSRPELQDDELEATVFWVLGAGVAGDERVQEKMSKLSKATNVISSPDVCPNTISLQGAAKAATRLNMLHPDHFPIPKFNPEPKMTLPESAGPVLLARPNQQISILPKMEVVQLPIAMTLPDGRFDFEGVRADTNPEYVRLAQEAREKVIRDEAIEGLEELPGNDVEIIPLGTGSAMPSKYRNVSATLLRVPGVGSILFDCGEGTLGQLSRLYEEDELREVLRDIKCIYISHLHADHHLGIAAVLKAWYQTKHNCQPARGRSPTPSEDGPRASPSPMAPGDLENVMWVVGLGKYDGLLREYADVEDFGYSWIRYIATEDIRTGEGRTLSLLDNLRKSLDLESVQTAKANHCIGATTCAFTFNNGFKFAYSGDTRPTEEFVRIGKGATLLLHEATFDDELVAEARAKKHSTTSEAIKAGLDMGARTLFLTHFSQRYPKLPVIATEGHGGHKMKVALAFDMMRMKVGEIGRFETFIPALRELYKDEAEEEDEVMVDGDVVEEAKKVPEKKPSKRQEKKIQHKKGKSEGQPPVVVYKPEVVAPEPSTGVAGGETIPESLREVEKQAAIPEPVPQVETQTTVPEPVPEVEKQTTSAEI
ncbi:hypothetical protein DFH27DRAFT_524078 [Peziza echinospora]|nr:hypothetical protein DFH27DRAFT_524078 [Peziza echinospora]